MEMDRNAPATAEGELRIDADPSTVFSVIAAIDQWPSWNPDVKSVSVEGPVGLLASLLKGYSRRTLDKGIRSVLAHLKTEAERRAATA
jgi:Polyketide cyclase / dehydrase and lipid transport